MAMPKSNKLRVNSTPTSPPPPPPLPTPLLDAAYAKMLESPETKRAVDESRRWEAARAAAAEACKPIVDQMNRLMSIATNPDDTKRRPHTAEECQQIENLMMERHLTECATYEKLGYVMRSGELTLVEFIKTIEFLAWYASGKSRDSEHFIDIKSHYERAQKLRLKDPRLPRVPNYVEGMSLIDATIALVDWIGQIDEKSPVVLSHDPDGHTVGRLEELTGISSTLIRNTTTQIKVPRGGT